MRDLEKEFKVKLDVPGDMRLATYFRKQGLAPLADVLEACERA